MDAHDSDMLYRYVCDCGHLWWGFDSDSRECGKCGDAARPTDVLPRAAQTVIVGSRVVVYEGAQYEKAEPQSKEQDTWIEREVEKKIDSINIASIDLEISLTKIPEGRVGYMARWFVTLILLHAANGVLDSELISFGLSISWLLWMFALVPILLVTVAVGPKKGGLMEQLEEVTHFEWLDEWFDGRQAKPRKPGVIEKQYLKGDIDADKMDTLMGASMGVKKDQERLRNLRELER